MQLRALTEPEAEERDRANHPHWGEGLTVQAHLRREAGLRDSRWGRQARQGWAWVDGPRILSSCETFRVDLSVRGQPGLGWQIASVFTEPELRGRGHASAMLEAVAGSLVQTPGAAALTLYSDVPPSIYERVGFVARPAWDRVLPADPQAGTLAGLQALPEGALWTLPRLPEPSGDVVIPVTAEMLDWQVDHARWEAALSAAFPGGRHAPKIDCGARLGDELIIWQVARDHLLILLLAAPKHPGPLLAAAARTAARLGLPTLRAWEVPGWPAGLGHRVPRAGARPMIRPLRADVDPEGWVDIPRGLWV